MDLSVSIAGLQASRQNHVIQFQLEGKVAFAANASLTVAEAQARLERLTAIQTFFQREGLEPALLHQAAGALLFQQLPPVAHGVLNALREVVGSLESSVMLTMMGFSHTAQLLQQPWLRTVLQWVKPQDDPLAQMPELRTVNETAPWDTIVALGLKAADMDQQCRLVLTAYISALRQHIEAACQDEAPPTEEAAAPKRRKSGRQTAAKRRRRRHQ